MLFDAIYAIPFLRDIEEVLMERGVKLDYAMLSWIIKYLASLALEAKSVNVRLQLRGERMDEASIKINGLCCISLMNRHSDKLDIQ